MEKKLSKKEILMISSMLFGLFFGAGNLIFPVSIGQYAGHKFIVATIGFCLTGVGLPLLGIIAMVQTKSQSLFDISNIVSKRFAYFFTLLLYLTIGPLFAIPRTATVSFQVGIAPLLAKSQLSLALFIFSLLFFAVVLYFSLKPSKILKWVGQFLNPLFLLFLAILLFFVIFWPMSNAGSALVRGDYTEHTFFTGFLDGYNTMDALASLAFGIILINVIHNLGVKEAKETAKSALKAGLVSSFAMIVIYLLLTYLGASSVAKIGICDDGGLVFFAVAKHYFGTVGGVLLGLIFTIACIKTSIGLVTSISETFCQLFPQFIKYRIYAVSFSCISFLIANVGLNTIIKFSLPILLFLYPLTIVLIFLGIFGSFFNYHKLICRNTMYVTIIFSGLHLFSSLFSLLIPHAFMTHKLLLIMKYLPLSSIGLNWLFPAIFTFFISFLFYRKMIK